MLYNENSIHYLAKENQIDFSENSSNQRINQNEFVIECLFIFSEYLLLFWPRREKTFFRWFANNKGIGQPAHPDQRLCYSRFGKYHI